MAKTKGTTGGVKPWTDREQLAAIRAYNAMLLAEQNGWKYSKAAANRYLRHDYPAIECNAAYGEPTPVFDRDRATVRRLNLLMLQGILQDRSRGSLELKWCNISAARVAMGLSIVAGYKPYGHGQKSLTDMIKAEL